ncbi:uncharacterized protein LOC135489298 [Lineus longissimus]|uniref:uncharacterized protein LOC135489298 n=1 Tax=Lineus longissimus TaxID=88925 RepID=UPI002B4ECBC1
MTIPEKGSNAFKNTTLSYVVLATNSTVVNEEPSAFTTVLECLGVAAILIAAVYGFIRVCGPRIRHMPGYDCQSICECCGGGIRDFFLWIRDACRNCFQGVFTETGTRDAHNRRVQNGRVRRRAERSSSLELPVTVRVEVRRPSVEEPLTNHAQDLSRRHSIGDPGAPPPMYAELTVKGDLDRIPSYEEAIENLGQPKLSSYETSLRFKNQP